LKVAYVDTSLLLAIFFAEPDSRGPGSRLRTFERIYSSNLLEAEFRSALVREQVRSGAERMLSSITWVIPARPLTNEFNRILGEGHLRGADLWHLACALLIAPDVRDLSFLTTDSLQKEVARKLGFTV